jgi:DNA methyltransferase 1-associated protein 1
VHQYSNDEYTQHLKDEDWSKDETDYLIEMCGEYDLRFVVIADRYDFPGGKPRSMEDIKARYYAICRRLIRSRISTEDIETRQQVLQTYAFDKNREVERKKAVARLFSRTPAQLAEEEALYIEARRIEQNEAKFAGEREELLRLLGGWESLQSATPTTIAMAGAGLGVPLSGSAAEAEELKRKKRKAEAESAALQATAGPSGINLAVLTPKQKAALKESAFDEQHYIQRFDPNTQLSSRPPYPHLIGTPSTHPPVAPSPHNPSSSHGAFIRSTRLLTAKLTMAQRTQQTLAELTPPIGQRLVFPNAKNCEKWEGLLGAVTSGLEMQKQLERVDAELRIAKARLNAMQGGAKVEEAGAEVKDTPAGDISITNLTAGGEGTAVA